MLLCPREGCECPHARPPLVRRRGCEPRAHSQQVEAPTRHRGEGEAVLRARAPASGSNRHSAVVSRRWLACCRSTATLVHPSSASPPRPRDAGLGFLIVRRHLEVRLVSRIAVFRGLRNSHYPFPRGQVLAIVPRSQRFGVFRARPRGHWPCPPSHLSKKPQFRNGL